MTARIFILAFLALFSAAAQALDAGAGRVDITPPVGTPLNGYGARMGRESTGVHDPLYARAVYLDDGTTKAFLVSVDLVAVNPELRARVLELAPDIVPRENIIIAATHTHNGAGGMTRQMPVRFVSGRYIPEVLESVAIGITQSMQQAYDSKKRAAIGFGTGKQTGLSGNRRFSGGPFDDQIGVILIEDADGAPISVITNFAAHPTSIEGENFYDFSADYPGFYYQEMEQLMGGQCVALFLNGTQGNQTIGAPEGKSGWARTEAVGRLLAARAKEVVNGITCGEATLRMAFAEPALPLTLADGMQPDKVLLQALEINDLLLTFIPGESCVEIGLELRRRALEKGYAAQFSVGLANDYLMYFTPKSLYAEFNYEAAMSFFGPRMEDWFYREFTRLMSRAEPVPDPPAVETPAVEQLEGGLLLNLSGDARAVGLARGRAFHDDLRLRYAGRVADKVRSGAWTPPQSIWAKWPGFMDPSPVMLPMLGMAARPLLKGVPDTAFLEMEGLAEGAELPFDAVWLLQSATTFDALEDKTPLFTSPLCTMFAAVGLRAGADDLLVARNLDWAWDELPVVTKVTPDTGRKYLQVGFSWNAGVFTGMNDAGIVVCLERVPGEKGNPMQGPPLEMIARDVLQQSEKYETALAVLAAQQHVRGVHALVAGFEGKSPRAAVIEFGPAMNVRRAEKESLLTGVDPASPAAPPEARSRYSRVLALTEGKRIVGDREMQRILSDTEPEGGGLNTIWNGQTRHSVVFSPKSGKAYVAFPGDAGGAGPYNTISLKD